MQTPDPRLAMLAQMREPAFALGCAVAETAKAAAVGDERYFALTELYLKCFAAVRLSIGLELRLEREARLAARDAARAGAEPQDAADDDEPEARLERLDVDAGGERERETASFPLLLRTLDGVVSEASSLVHPEPAELPTLRDLMQRLGSPAPEAPRRPQGDLRLRLAGSSAVGVLPRPAAPGSGVLGSGGVRSGPPGGHATGPPGRSS